MTKTFIILLLFNVLLIISLIFMIKRYNKLKRQYKELKNENQRFENYHKTTEAKLTELHNGDPVDNAIDVLSK